MKIELNNKDFIKALEIGGTFAGRNKVLPILDCIHVKIKPNYMLFISTDNENTISSRLDVDTNCSDEVSFCVNFKDIVSYVKLIRSDEIIMNIEDEVLTISHKKGAIDLAVQSDENFPIVRFDNAKAKIDLPSSLLNNWIVDGHNFTARDDMRPILNCLYIYGEDNTIGCCASDSHYMFWDSVDYEIDDFHFLLNNNASQAVCKCCANGDTINIEVSDSFAKFKCGNTCVLSRLIEGKFPNFKVVIPKEQPIKAKIGKDVLNDAINRCKLTSNISRTIKVEIKDNNMQLSCEDNDFRKKSIEKLEVESNGNIAIAFNADKLQTLLSTITTDDVVMYFSEQNRPMTMVENSPSNKILLIMPMLL